MATTRTSTIETAVRAGESLLKSLGNAAIAVVRENVEAVRRRHGARHLAAEREAVMTLKSETIVLTAEEAEAYDELMTRRAEPVGKPLPIE